LQGMSGQDLAGDRGGRCRSCGSGALPCAVVLDTYHDFI
jgi:hypothetical protein